MLFMFNHSTTTPPHARPRPGVRHVQPSMANQCGFTLIELMIGITIGLMVVIAAIGSLVFTQLTSTVVGDSSRLQQKADAIFRNVGFHILQAGATELSAAANGRVVFSTAFTGFNPTITGATGGRIFSVHGVDGASNAPDTLRVSYEDNGRSRDCLGNRPTLATRVDNAFSVTGGDLMCQGATSAASQSIADGIEDFQVTYGVQTVVTPGTVWPTQYRFYPAGTVPDWTNVQAISICLQLTGDNQGNPQPGLVTTGCRGQTVANDGRLRKVYRQTFTLRNALL